MSLYERDQKALSKLSFLRFFPQAVTGGDGAWLIGDDGRRLLDFSASWGAASLGHSHPAVRHAVVRALESQAGASHLSSANLPAVELAEKLLSLVPERAAGRVWLGHSGSDANETVARAVVATTGRPRIVSFKGAYHGGTAGSMAISGHPVQQGVPKAPGLTLVDYPDPYRGGAEAAAAALEQLESLFAGPVPPEEVAALFLEPTIRRLARHYEALLRAMAEDPDRKVREEAVFALSQLPGERAVDALLAVVEDRQLDLERRKNALFWLVQSESDRAFTSVERLLGQAPRP